MNDLQKVELDLFRCFAEICEKLNLGYYLVCGSVLGAVRHGGFIPWDDDMDIGMLREDYNKFMVLAPALLPEGIFLQNYKTDPAYPMIFAKLRNSQTTYVEKVLSKLDINHGVYIDIFPLDGYPDDSAEQKLLAFKKLNYSRCKSYSIIKPTTIRGKIFNAFIKTLGIPKRLPKVLVKYEALISKYPTAGSKLICNHGTPYKERDYIPSEYYGKGTEVLYEGIKVRIPEKYDEYLTWLYGDWRTPPTPEKQKEYWEKGYHVFAILDTKKPYTEYAKQGKNGKIEYCTKD